jgi:hypothetical protein
MTKYWKKITAANFFKFFWIKNSFTYPRPLGGQYLPVFSVPDWDGFVIDWPPRFVSLLFYFMIVKDSKKYKRKLNILIQIFPITNK